jgi:DNA-binding winged helix-turn-helix (wHTH) protein
MSSKQLYHIETNTLIILYPKGMILEVRCRHNAIYNMDKTAFSILYLLCISHPHLVKYDEILEILESIQITDMDVTKLDKEVTKLKKYLKKCGVKNLIINIKGMGYTISNSWVEPGAIRNKTTKNKFSTYFKKIWKVAMPLSRGKAND